MFNLLSVVSRLTTQIKMMNSNFDSASSSSYPCLYHPFVPFDYYDDHRPRSLIHWSVDVCGIDVSLESNYQRMRKRKEKGWLTS